MPINTKRYRNFGFFSGIVLDSGSSSNVPFQFNSGTLKTVPVSGGLEFNGNRFYGTLNSTFRKPFAFLDDFTNFSKTIDYIGHRENNIGHSSSGYLGYSSLSSQYLYSSGSITGLKTSSNQFTRTSGSWASQNLIGKYAIFENSNSSQILKIINNTNTIINLNQEIYLSSINLVKFLTKENNFNIIENYMDTLFTGTKFSDILNDGKFIWLLPSDTEQSVYKLNLSTNEIIIINHSIPIGELKTLIFDGLFIWCINKNGGSHLRINSKTNAQFNVSNTLTGIETALLDGNFIWLFGYFGSNFTYYKYDLKGDLVSTNTFTNLNNKNVKALICTPNLPNKIFILWNNILSSTHGIDLYSSDSDTFQTNLYTSNDYDIYNFCFDGLKLWWNYRSGGSGVTFSYFNIYNQQGTIHSSFSFLGKNPKSMIFTGENILWSAKGTGIYLDYYSLDPNGNNLPNLYNGISTDLGNCHNFYYSDNKLFIWGGKYLSWTGMPKNHQRKLVFSDEEKTFLSGGIVNNWKITTNDYYLYYQDYGLLIDTSISSKNIYLPDATKCKNQIFVFKDNSGNASINNITINTILSQNIDGLINYIINLNYGKISIISNGTNWRII